MARKDNFRWRTNPGIIAQYFLDRNVKHGENVVLKPNEACVVVENGSVIGISTQTKMEVNPKAGLLSKIFGQGQPNRAFLFVLLGPHDVLILVSGRTADGHDLSGMVSIKVEFNTQDTPLLLQFPAKGERTIGIDNLVEALSPEVNALVNAEVIGPHTLEQIRTNADLQEDLKASIRANLSKTMRSFGLQFINCYANWNQTEFENLISMQNEVDNLRKHKTILDEQAQIEMEATLSKRKRELDLLHHIHVQDITVEAQRNIAAEIAEINAQKDLENSRWEVLKSQKENEQSLQHELEEADMQFALKASQHQIEIARNEAEVAQIKHEQDLSMRRDNLILENKVEDEKVKRAMSMFEQVQENKRKRMELQSDLNIERQAQSDNLQAEMMRLAAENNALDSNVMQEFLKQQTEQKLADGSGSETSSNNSKDAEENAILSPDGKFMWDGKEWIPANNNTEEAKKKLEGNALNMQDSIVSGDVVHKTVINNDATAVTSAVITALQELGVIGQSSAKPQPPPMPEIELPPSFKIGDHVEYHSPTNARWLDRCRVINVNDDGTYRIEVPKDGGVIETKYAVVIGTAPGTIRPASPPYSIGDKVLVNWKNYGTYYPGKIASEHEDHTFLIHFDDGDIEDNVEWGRIEKIPENSETIQEYVDHISEAEKDLIDAFMVFDENNSGTIPAKKYFEILTEMGDEPIPVEDVINEFEELGIGWDSEIDYRELAKLMVSSEDENLVQQKPEVVIRDAEIKDNRLYGYAYDHPKLGEGSLSTSTIQNITYDERATARLETKNTVYVVGPTGWKTKPENHPFNNYYSVGQQVKVEWKGSWWDALIREKNEEQYLIHYVGFDTSWDEWVTVERMKNN